MPLNLAHFHSLISKACSMQLDTCRLDRLLSSKEYRYEVDVEVESYADEEDGQGPVCGILRP